MPSTSSALTASWESGPCSHPSLTAHVALAGLASTFFVWFCSILGHQTLIWLQRCPMLGHTQLASASLRSNQWITSVMMRLPYSANYQAFFRAQPEDHLFQQHLGCLLKIMIPSSLTESISEVGNLEFAFFNRLLSETHASWNLRNSSFSCCEIFSPHCAFECLKRLSGFAGPFFYLTHPWRLELS